MFLRACWPRFLVLREGGLFRPSPGRSPEVPPTLALLSQLPDLLAYSLYRSQNFFFHGPAFLCHAFTSVVPASHAFTIARPRRGIACRTPLRSRVSDRRRFARYRRIPAACCGRCAC